MKPAGIKEVWCQKLLVVRGSFTISAGPLDESHQFHHSNNSRAEFAGQKLSFHLQIFDNAIKSIMASIETLPNDIFISLCTFLSPSDFVHLFSASKRFLQLNGAQVIWKHLFERFFGVCILPVTSSFTDSPARTATTKGVNSWRSFDCKATKLEGNVHRILFHRRLYLGLCQQSSW